MGFRTQALKYALILAPQTCNNPEELKHKIEKTILKYENRDSFKKKIDGNLVKCFINNFKIEEAKQELEWALKYWKKEREVIPTRKPSKCQACGFKKKCNGHL